VIGNLQKKIALRKSIESGGTAPAPLTQTIRERQAAMPKSLGPQGEVSRIVSMPVVRKMEKEEVEAFSRERVLRHAFESGFRLNPDQAEALKAYEDYGGVLAPIGVGRGKTLASLMIADAAYRRGINKIVLHLPPTIVSQLVGNDIRWARNRVPISFPIHVLHGKGRKARLGIAKSGRKGLYIIPYSLLSTEDSVEVIREVRPGLVVGDEAHQIANKSAARTRRVLSVINEIREDGDPCQCVFMSGTITSKSVMDYYHLIRTALNEYCPLPLTAAFATEWAMIIDSVQEKPEWQDTDGTEEFTGPVSMRALLEWARIHFPERKAEFTNSRTGLRRAYQLRLETCPGVVVSTGEDVVKSSLLFDNTPVKDHEKVEGWDKLKEHIKRLEDEWVAPSGDEIDHKIHAWKWMNELSAGFYNELYWPDTETYAARTTKPVAEADEILTRAKKYHEAGQEYAKVLRPWLLELAPPGLDTPFLVGKHMSSHGASKEVPSEIYEAWTNMKSLDFEGRPDRDSRAIRVCPYKVNWAVEWAMKEVPKGRGAIIWAHHREMRKWIAEKIEEAGLPVFEAGPGRKIDRALRDQLHKDKIVVASIKAHGEGKNLQYFQHQCMVQWPRPAKTAEQLLGRLHRQGQEADEIVVRTCFTTDFDHMNFGACLNDALYIHQTTGSQQKMVYGSYSSMPKVFPPAVLREAGAGKVRDLTEDQRKLLQEKFGIVI
jgi:hypothetical protein